MSRTAVYFDSLDLENCALKVERGRSVTFAKLVVPSDAEHSLEFQTPVLPVAWDARGKCFALRMVQTDEAALKFTQFLVKLQRRFQVLLQAESHTTQLGPIFDDADGKYEPVLVFKFFKKPTLYSVNKERIEFEYQNLDKELCKDRRVAVIMSVLVILNKDESKPSISQRAVLCMEKPFPFDLNVQLELKAAQAAAAAAAAESQ